MASYGELLHSISTAAINQLLTQYGFTRWAYFVNEGDGTAGVAFANDSTIGLYSASDINKLSLTAFGIIPIQDLQHRTGVRMGQSQYETLNLMHRGDAENIYCIVLFTDASRLGDDEQLLPNFDSGVTLEWTNFLRQRGMRQFRDTSNQRKLMKILAACGVLVLVLILVVMLYKPQ